jgi:Fanconi anemia group M protein|tara:strand:+ start:800 stop:3016 length:2217 start_codon:yes stop_codon:yes gene_type:complete
MIKNFKPRLYQESILNTTVSKNTLVVLPTGLGKTNVFLMLASLRLKMYPNSKILFVGPTKPLIDQYLTVFKKHFEIPEEKMAIFTGMVKPEKRAELWKTSKVIFSTPQGLENDIISKRINLEEVSLLGVDEAHRAVGNYAYVFVAKQYQKLAKYPRILALTASPGSDMEKIKEVCQNLHIEDVEVRTQEDPDVKPYVQEMDLEWINVELSHVFFEIQKYLNDCLKERLDKLKSWDILKNKDLSFVSKRELLAIQGQIHGSIAKGESDSTMWSAISILAEIMKVYHAVELLETQGITSLHTYLKGIYDQSFKTKVKAVKNLVQDPNFKSALYKTEKLFEQKVQHPKLIKLQEIIREEIKNNPETKLIIFNQYRDNALDIKNKLNEIDDINAELFVGQTKKGGTGLSQKDQKKVLDNFREGKFNVIVATSIGEEGLDIPKVDLVIFFEPIPSAIRTIQRRGRTGRQDKGRVIILMAKKTRDEGYRWSAHHKEKRMYRNLKILKKSIFSMLPKQEKTEQDLSKFIKEKKIKIYSDHREKGSGVIKNLLDLNVDLRVEQLGSADFLLSSRVGVEFKTVEDFINSIIDGRLLDQLKDLKRNFERPLIIIEGENDIYSVRKVHKNAIQGMMSTIAVSYGIPIIQTKTSNETASLMYNIAKREQEETTSVFDMHGSKKPLTLKEQQEYIVSSFPGIGTTLAKPLLKKFKTIKKLVNAKQEQLEKIDKIGPKKAEEIQKVLDSEYE